MFTLCVYFTLTSVFSPEMSVGVIWFWKDREFASLFVSLIICHIRTTPRISLYSTCYSNTSSSYEVLETNNVRCTKRCCSQLMLLWICLSLCLSLRSCAFPSATFRARITFQQPGQNRLDYIAIGTAAVTHRRSNYRTLCWCRLHVSRKLFPHRRRACALTTAPTALQSGSSGNYRHQSEAQLHWRTRTVHHLPSAVRVCESQNNKHSPKKLRSG